MKQNKIFRLSAILLVLTLLSTCVISGTFAKYVTKDNASDTARVAKWGITVDATDDADGKNVLDTKDGLNEAHISTAQTLNLKLMAPGTKGNLVNVDVNGKPEVSVNVTYELTLTLTGWEIAPAVEYCPLVFTVKFGTETKTFAQTGTIADVQKGTIAELIAAIKEYVEAKNGNYDPQTNFDGLLDLNISWEWAYSTSPENDVKDTALGDLSTAPQLSIQVVTTLTQID